jgi:DNA-directed RNA polymerase subunit RPC12/RpoP
LSKDFIYIKFPVGTNKVYLDDVCYELDRDTDTLTISLEDYFSAFPERLALSLIYIFGLGGVNILKMVAMLTSILLFFLLILETILEGNSSLSPTLLIFTSLIFFIISSYMSEIKNYYNISKCSKCGRDFAYKEIREPLLKMVSTYDKFEKTKTRYMKCIYCNNEDIKTEIEYKTSKPKSKKIIKIEKPVKDVEKSLL